MPRQGEKGAVAVEFALILPILLVIVVGIIEFGLILFRQEVITNASREGARAGIILSVPKPTETDIENVVNTYLTGAGFDATAATVTVDNEGGGFGDPPLIVQVDYLHTFLFLPTFIGGGPSLTLRAVTTMRHE